MIYPFKQVENYHQMLNAIAFWNFIFVVVVLLSLSSSVGYLKDFMSTYPLTVNISDNTINLAVVLIAIIVALISRIFKLHDKISDVFGIRRYYDLNNIMLPLANQVEIDTSGLYRQKLLNNRSQVMNKIFYKYASSTKENCQIDHHLVIQAMSQLTALWISVEFIFWFTMIFLILMFTGYSIMAMWFLVIGLVLILISWILYTLCKKYTRQEIDAILDDDQRKADIKKYLDGI